MLVCYAMSSPIVPAGCSGKIRWIGVNADRGASMKSKSMTAATVNFEGIQGEVHGGLYRQSDTRTMALHERGITIRNVRQVSIMSTEEVEDIRREMGLGQLNPAWMGTSLVLSGIPDLSHVPPSSRLQAPSGCTLVVDMENPPCCQPGEVIQKELPGVGTAGAFKRAACNRRGITAWVERPGTLKLGDELKLFTPAQRAWRPHNTWSTRLCLYLGMQETLLNLAALAFIAVSIIWYSTSGSTMA